MGCRNLRQVILELRYLKQAAIWGALIKIYLFWGQSYLFRGEGKMGSSRVFTSFKDGPTNSHINGKGSARAFH